MNTTTTTTGTTEQTTETLVKYKNRKIYSKTTSGYVSLKELGRAVNEGKFFKVVEKATGKDITNKTRLLALASLEE